MSWNKTKQQGLEAKIKKVSVIKKVHDDLVHEIEQRCYAMGCAEVKTCQQFYFYKLAKPKEVKSGHGEIDVYAIHKSRRVFIFEIKSSYRKVSATKQLMRAEAYLYHIYPNHRFYLFHITPKKIKSIKHNTFTWPWDEKYNDEKRYSQQKGKARKEKETVKNYNHHIKSF